MKASTYYTISLFFCSLAVIFSCQSKQRQGNVPNKLKITSEINSLMSQQQQAWNNGDIEEYMRYYWNNDSLKFIGKRGITYGHSSTLESYKKNYPTAEAMGRLQFSNLSTDIIDDSTAFVIGRWRLFRTEDTLSGHYSLLWKKKSQGWTIIADHSS